MAFIVAQGLPLPVYLQRGKVGYLPIDLLLTPGSGPVSGDPGTILVTLPNGIVFPEDGTVRYIVPKGSVNPTETILKEASFDPKTRVLRFSNELHLNDDSDQANGFYSVSVRALDDAPLGLVWGAIQVPGPKPEVKAPLRIQVSLQPDPTPHPQPVGKNLIENGSFGSYDFKKPGGDWYDNNGTEYAKQLQNIAPWTVGKYTGSGNWQVSKNGPDGLIDVIRGEGGRFPVDEEHAFTQGENIVDINGKNTCGFIEQTVTVDPGVTYELSFYTGFHFLRERDKPTYLRAEVLFGEQAVPLACEDYVQYFNGQAFESAKDAKDAKKKLNEPGWRKRRLRFQAPSDVRSVTVRFANPGYAGFNTSNALPDGDTGMLLAHLWMSPVQ
ncbi:hypothetical protein [Streptomyces lunalinharesii]|uniref:Uncharacterized protein n=1 Tax=Streptomyces lunalinharesii TaxID=333384 RepID=A0ABP6ESW1_9ACTN